MGAADSFAKQLFCPQLISWGRKFFFKVFKVRWQFNDDVSSAKMLSIYCAIRQLRRHDVNKNSTSCGLGYRKSYSELGLPGPASCGNKARRAQNIIGVQGSILCSRNSMFLEVQAVSTFSPVGSQSSVHMRMCVCVCERERVCVCVS